MLRALIAAVLGVAIGVAAGYARWHEPFDPFARQRWAILNAADDAPRGGALLLGDSFVQRLYLPELCGLPVFNAGMAGARSDQIAPLADPLVTKLKPRLVIVSAGSNDRLQGRKPVAFAPKGALVIGRDIPMTTHLDKTDHPDAEGRAEMKRRMQEACG